MSIPRGVTPTFTLTFAGDLDLTQAAHVYVSFKSGAVNIVKQDTDLTIAAKSVSVYLSQSETLSLTRGTTAIQVNWTYGDGSRAASNIVTYSFGDQLLNRVVE